MNNHLFSRALGSTSHQHFATSQQEYLIRSLHHAGRVSFTYRNLADTSPQPRRDHDLSNVDTAHPAGVNSVVIDRFEGRYLLSGGADSSISIWDLEAAVADEDAVLRHRPITKESTGTYGVTDLSFYPFDSLAFLSSGYDHHLRLYSSETLECSASFDMASVVYSHSMSMVASHLLVACATQHPAVRLVDLKSGASTHSLAGHGGAVMSVAWHPSREHLLVSGAADGSARLWDIRRSASSLGVLDMDVTIGSSPSARSERGRAHTSMVNGVLWTEEGDYIITAGHDEVVRVWDAATAANTLINYGPALKNSHSSTLLPLVTPSRLTGRLKDVLVFPNPRELLLFELHTGTMLSRLRTPSYQSSNTIISAGKGTRNVVNRTTSLAWRAHQVELYSAHTDGTIRCWQPRTRDDALADEEADDDAEDQDGDRKRKRDELDDIVDGLTKRKVTFI